MSVRSSCSKDGLLVGMLSIRDLVPLTLEDSAPRWRMSSSTGSAGDPGLRRGPPVRERMQDGADRDPARKDEQRPE
jgi:hypothetical protein